MRTKMTQRTRISLLAGVVLLVVGGGGAAYLGSRGPTVDPSVGKVTAYYAEHAVEAGTTASAATAQGLIRARLVLPTDRPANAVTEPSQLIGRVAAARIPAGAVVTTEMFPDPQTRIGTVVIPPGKRALAIELAPVPGIAGFAGAGDRVDVYGIVKGDSTAPAAASAQPGVPAAAAPAGATPAPSVTVAPAVRLVLQGVDVLNVNGAGLPAAQGQVGSPNLIYLLAVTPADAERLIYLNEFEKLYFDLVPKGEGPVKTPGAGPAGVLAV